MLNAFKTSEKKYSHCVSLGSNEIVLYFNAEMKAGDIEDFSNMLGIKEKTEGIYVCIVLSQKKAPRTFISYKRDDGSIKELFDISAGIDPIDIIRRNIAVLGGNV